MYRKSCLLNIYPYFVISLFCIGRKPFLPWCRDFHTFSL